MKRPIAAGLITEMDTWPPAFRYARIASTLTGRRWYVRKVTGRWLVTTLPRADRTRPCTHRCHARECRSCVYVDIANGRKP